MELFQKAKVVRLRSHHDKYLIADEDEETVTQDRNGLLKNAKWTVEILQNLNCLRFKSCYGKYLTASNMPFLLGMSGKKVLQTMPRRLDSSVEWEPVREGVQIKLKTRYGQFLRANGGLPPWRNQVTHDIPHRTSTQDWILWDIDLVEIRAKDPKPKASPKSKTNKVEDNPPERPPCNNNDTNSNKTDSLPPSEPGSPTEISLHFRKVSRNGSDEFSVDVPVKNEGRLINYSVADENGEADDSKNNSFTFKGSVVEELKQKLEEETGLHNITVCSRNPLNGKLFPVRLHLPPNNANFNVVVVPSSAEG